MSADIINKTTGDTVHVSANSIVLDDPSVVRLDLQRDQLTALQREGNDLIVRLANGEVIRVANFYVQENGASSDLVLREGDHSLWVANPAATGPARFTSLHGLNELVATSDASSGGGGGALLPVLLGIGAAGGLAVGLSGGGGKGGGGVQTPAADTISPPAPSATVNGNGTGVIGTGEAGATVQVRDGAGALIGSGTVGADGNYSLSLTQPQTNGQTVTVTQSDPAGNVSPPTTAVAPDVQAPPPPSAEVDPATATVRGSAEPGATVTIMDPSGQPLGEAVAEDDGSYVVPLPPGQLDGDTVEVRQTDPAGNTSDPTMVATPDMAQPDAPTAEVMPNGSAVIGTGEPGATVVIVDPDGTLVGSDVVDPDGTWAIPLTPGTADGDPLEVRQTDPAGNDSPTTVVVTPDLAAPPAPTAMVAPNGASVSGMGEPGATVTVADAAGTPLGTAIVAGDGSYLVPLTPAQANGETLEVTQADPAGNSAATTVTAPDITAPAAPTASVSADGTSVSGTGEAGATVTIRSPAGVPVGTATVAEDGSFTATLAPAQANGQVLQLSQADAAGNSSPIVPLTAPDITAPLGLTAAVDGNGTIVSGTGEPGATVTVRDPLGAAIGTATVAGDGSYVAALTPAQINGQQLQVTQADLAGNPSAPVATTAPDLVAPAAPGGAVSADGTSVTGTGEPGATLIIRNAAGIQVGTATVAADGSYTAPLSPAQANGETLEVRQADVAGNLSPATSVIAPDITAPLGLTAAVNASGTLVTGTGEPGAAVTVRDPLGTAIGGGTVAANGSYSVVLTTPQANGQILQVTQADATGNPSAPVPATAPDLTAPGAPTATVAVDGSTVSGSGEPGATVTVRDAGGTPIGSATVAGDGSYSVTLGTPQTNGETVTVRQADPAGNLSPQVATTAPDITAPIGLTAAVNGTGTIVTGTGEAGATVTVRDPLGAPIGSAVVAANGAYAVVLTTSQANGETLQVTQVDVAGNPSLPTPALAPDITAPVAPALTISADGTTATGTGEPGATVTVSTPSGTILGSGPVAGDGSYSIALAPVQANGETVFASQADIAGNVSPTASVTAPDVTIPAAPVAAIDATGTVVTGTGEPGAAITVRDPANAVIGTGTADAAGNFSVTLTTPQIDSETLSVTQADGAGNPSLPAPLVAPDVTAPPAPAATVAADGASVTGTGEAGATVVITDPVGLPIGTALVAPDGSFTAAINPPQTNGQLLGLAQTDDAGNVSPQGSTVAPDLVPNDSPGAPTATVAADGTTVFGTGQVGATVTVSGANGVPIGTATVVPGGTYTVTLTTPQVNGETVRVVQADAEGDVSPPATAIAPDLTPPAIPVATIDPTGTVVTGTGEAGATLRVADAGGTVIGAATVNANGSFAVTLGAPLTNGEALAVTQVDGAGNISPPAPLTAPDLTAPATPTASVSTDGATVSGIGEPGATVTIADAAGNPIATAIVAPGGGYTATLGTPLLNGEVLTALQTDPAGNISPSVTATAPDTTAPAAPIAVVDPSGLIVTGTGEAGATVIVRDPAGTPIATALVGANGGFSATLPVAQLDGQRLQVTQADAAGNISPPAAAVAPDVTAPAAPTGTVAPGGATVTGTGEPGATVTVRDPAGVAIGSALVAGDGSYTAALTPVQTNGQVLTLRQADAAGNLSPNVTATAPDSTAPVAPTATVQGDGLVVSGTGEPGATVTVRDPLGAAIGSAVVASNGAYAVALTTPQANGQTLQVSQADAAGNASPAVPALAPDFTAPTAPSAAVSGDGTTVSGVGEAGATVRITNGAGAVIGTALVAGNGSYAAVLTTPQANGETVNVTQADPTGNVSPAVTATAPDITAPTAPTGVAINGDGTWVTGRGEANTTVEVRDAGGAVIGTARVAADGSFAVPIADPQTAGEALSVSLRDAAGNQSGAVPLVAPFDIDAFDDNVTASIDLVPVTTNENLGTANYLALVSLGLLNLDAQVLTVPTVQFTVDPGHVLDATFTYDALLNLGVLSGYSVAVQRFDGTNWVSIDGQGNNSLLELGLLNGNLVATETLGPGQYRAFVTFDGALGVGVLGGLNVSGVDSDYTDVAAVNPTPTSGNVITDAGVAGAIDLVNAQTVVQSVTINGVTVAIAGTNTTVDGAWGTLIINPDGSYVYTPDANAAAIGKSDVFTYTLLDRTDGEVESATLTVTIGSPDITGAPVAANDTAIATATFENVVTTTPAAIDSSFATPTAIILTGAKTGTVTDSFTVAAHSTSDVTLSAIQASGLSVLPTYTITVSNAQGVVVGTLTQTALAGLGLGTGVALTLQDLPSGTYSYTVSSTNLLGTGYGTNVYVGQTVTHLDQYHLLGTTSVQGELLANDTAGTSFATVRVQSGGSFVEVGEIPITIVGAHGTLTVDETGHYSYQPTSGLAYSGADPVDSFSYQLVQPNGTVATAHLDVTVDINNGVIPALYAVEAIDMPHGVDAVPLGLLTAEPVAPAASEMSRALALSVDLLDDGTIADSLARFLDSQPANDPAEHGTIAVATLAAPDLTAASSEDPLGYLAVSPLDDEHHRMSLTHAI